MRVICNRWEECPELFVFECPCPHGELHEYSEGCDEDFCGAYPGDGYAGYDGTTCECEAVTKVAEVKRIMKKKEDRKIAEFSTRIRRRKRLRICKKE